MLKWGDEVIQMEVRMRGSVAVIDGGENLFADAASTLDLIATIGYVHGAARIAAPRESVAPAFFRLATGLAGEVLQKFVNYHVKLALFGDFSIYQSGPLRDFMRESNAGRDIFFVPTEDEAVERLSKA